MVILILAVFIWKSRSDKAISEHGSSINVVRHTGSYYFFSKICTVLIEIKHFECRFFFFIKKIKTKRKTSRKDVNIFFADLNIFCTCHKQVI